MTECSGNCAGCDVKDCSEPKSLLEKTHELSNVKKVIGVVSGKGGVGKSLVSGLLASLLNKEGFNVAILDADITGPSIPKMFGIKGGVGGDENGIYPRFSKGGVAMVSSNLLIKNEEDPIVWRGVLISSMVKQFWSDVIWNDVDYMLIDMPPGTGDVSLTVFQSIPIDGVIIVTSPQDLVSMIVKKAMNMADLMNIPVIGVVENMSFVKCPKCGEEIKLFSKKDEKSPFELLDRMPIDTEIAHACDLGKIEELDVSYLKNTVETIIERLPISEK